MDKNCCFQFIILFLLILPLSHVFSQKEINCNDYYDDKTIGCITFMVEKSKPLADEEIQAEKLAKNQVCQKINGTLVMVVQAQQECFSLLEQHQLALTALNL